MAGRGFVCKGSMSITLALNILHPLFLGQICSLSDLQVPTKLLITTGWMMEES